MLAAAAACAPLEPMTGARAEPPAAASGAGPWVAAVPRIDPAAAAETYAGARTYAGTLACAGCPERRLTLTVFADGTYRMRKTGAAGEVHEMGRWLALPESADTLALHGHSEGATLLRRVVPDGLAIVDHEGREIRGLDNATLARAAQIDPLVGPLRLVGRYRREGADRVFVECVTGRRMPVVAGVPASGAPQAVRLLESARAALDAAHQAVILSPDDAVLAIVRGYVVPLAAGPAAPAKEGLVVVAFERAMRDGRCEDVGRGSP